MTREEIIDAILAAAADKRLSCEKAHELSRELKIPLHEIGRVCNDLKIRISACRLGCF